MTHIHIPDGVLPVWLWISGILGMAVALGICLVRLRSMDMKKKIPLLGAMSAAMLVVMSIEILPPVYHVNLSIVAGILLGPALGFVAAFIVNLMLAMIGHGGITVLGLNTLLLGTEAVLGHVFFHLLPARVPIFKRAASATVFTLLLTTLLLIGIVAVSHLDPVLFLGDEDHGVTHTGQTIVFSLVGAMVLAGWTIEAVITGAVVKFLSRVKPELLVHALHPDKGAHRT